MEMIGNRKFSETFGSQLMHNKVCYNKFNWKER